MHRYFLLLAAVAATTLPATAGQWPDALRAALEAPEDGPDYAYEMTFDDGEIQAAGTVDASQPAGSRIIVTAPAEDQWPEGFAEGLAAMDTETDGDIWCSDVARNVPDEVILIEEDATMAVYGFTPVAGPDANRAERKMMKRLTATITVAKDSPAILAFHMWAEKSFKPMILARVRTFDMAISCARAPDGRTYSETMNFEITGSAMGKSFDEFQKISITQLLHSIEMPETETDNNDVRSQ